MIETTIIPLAYLLSAILFILGLKGLTRVRTARRGNLMAAAAMLIAIVTTLVELGQIEYRWILIGLAVGSLVGGFAALRVQMTSMPEMVALLNGFGGAASTLVASSVLYLEVIEPGHAGSPASLLAGGTVTAVTLVLSMLIGAVTFSGSLIAFLKLSGRIGGKPVLLRREAYRLSCSGSIVLNPASDDSPEPRTLHYRVRSGSGES